MSESNKTSIIPMDKASAVAELCITQPEAIYEPLHAAEKWCKEMREKARQTLIARVPKDVQKSETEADTCTITTTRNKAKLKPDTIHKALTTLGLDPKLVVYPQPVEYDALPNARETLETMLKTGVLSQAVYDTFFETPGYTVTTKPKSARTIASGE